MQVVSAIAAGLADAGIASEPAALAFGLAFVQMATERFDILIPRVQAAPGKCKVCTGCSARGGYVISWRASPATTPQVAGRLLRLSSHSMDANQADLYEIGSGHNQPEGNPDREAL